MLKVTHLDQFIIVISFYQIEVGSLGSWPNNRKYSENDTREVLIGTPNWLEHQIANFLIQKCIGNYFITIISNDTNSSHFEKCLTITKMYQLCCITKFNGQTKSKLH